jgi:hypothetical protein
VPSDTSVLRPGGIALEDAYVIAACLVMVVLIAPLPLQTHPKVTVVAGSTRTDFIASVVAPGALAPSALVLLPEKASALVEHVWLSVPELEVTIVEPPHRSLQGVIPTAAKCTSV